MKAKPSADNELLRRWGELVSAAQVRELRALGLDVVEAERDGASVAGADGRRFIDCISGAGVYNLGRRPAEVLAALRAALHETDQGNFLLISEEKGDLGRRLAAFAPGDLECAMYSVVRGEAFDFACKLARGATGRPGLVAVEGSWFGHTGFALSMSERRDRSDFAPLIPSVTIVPFGDLLAAEEAIGPQTAAFCLELVQAENGCRLADSRYVRALARLCRERGAQLVVDETQSGLGRCGARFACEQAGIVPDVLVMGEALGAGVFPICATLFPQRLAAFLDKHPLIHLSTFGGSDVGCVVAQRALDVYERERPWENAAEQGERLKEGLLTLAPQHRKGIKGVDGAGLLLAVDLGTERRARAFCKALSGAGALALPGAVARHTVVLRPSLLIGAADVERVLAAATAAAEGL